MDQKERDNLLRWDGIRRGFYEVYYLKWNDFRSNTAAWIRYTLTSPVESVGAPYCELWGIFFDISDPKQNFAVKQRFPISRLGWSRNRFRVDIAEAHLDQNSCRAEIVDPKTGHEMSWEMAFLSNTPTYRYFPGERYYSGGFPKTKGLSPHVHGFFSGTLIADGRKIEILNAPGQQTHLWGTQHAQRWAWGHCNAFAEDDNAVWEGLDAQVKLGPVVSPHMSLFYLYLDGEHHCFNHPVQWVTNKSKWELGRWQAMFKNDKLICEAKIRCDYDEMVAVTYMDPTGEKLWCNNSKVAEIELRVTGVDGKRIKTLTSRHGCAAEFVDRRTYKEVPVRI